MKIKRYIVRKLELIIRYNRYFFLKRRRFDDSCKERYILRMDYKIDKKRKVFKEKYDSDYSKVYKYFLIFTIN